MSNLFRFLTESTLETLEPGAFQDFCLDFLPVLHHRFKGLERFGHTAAGKTRAGTPDLLRTDPLTGAQVAVQCGTDKDYWSPNDTVTALKPVKDALKCIDTLSNLSEVVLISNHTIPTNAPNIKSDVIQCLKERTNATLTLLSLEDIGQFLATSLGTPDVKPLLERYFPEVFAALQPIEQANRYRVAMLVSQQRAVEAGTLFGIVDEAFRVFPGVREAHAYVLDRVDTLATCRLPACPPFAGLDRESVTSLLLATPFGKVWLLLGIPKIGKTSLLQQLTSSWSPSDVHWFDIPIDAADCTEEITSELARVFGPATAPLPAGSESGIRSSPTESMRTVVIIDNANHLPEQGLHRLARSLRLAKQSPTFLQSTIILATNRVLPALTPAIDSSVSAPSWPPVELGLLLQFFGVPCDQEHLSQYLDFLAVLSGGHPLVALALARKHPTLAHLLASHFTSAPRPADEQLSQEIQLLLYNDILRDADSQNFVHRLSILTGGTPRDVLEVLRKEVRPEIPTPTSLLLDRLVGSVIEGDDERGYGVPFVFREIASQKIAGDERQAVYTAVATRLLTPRDRTIHADRTVSGVFYACLAGDLPSAVFWTTVLLNGAMTKRLSDALLGSLLSRLGFMLALSQGATSEHQVHNAVMRLTFAMAYGRLGRHREAAEVLERIVPAAIPVLDGAEQPDTYLLRYAVAIYRGLSLGMVESPDALRSLCQISESDVAHVPLPLRVDLLDLLSKLLGVYPLADLRPDLVRRLTANADQWNDLGRTAVLVLACSIGWRAKVDGQDRALLGAYFDETPWGQLLTCAATASHYLELGHGAEAAQEIEQAIALARTLRLIEGDFWARLQLVKGDILYLIQDLSGAMEVYTDGRSTASPLSFERAWCSWRTALLQEDPNACAEAARVFKHLKLYDSWARALGAQGAVLIRSGQKVDGLRCFQQLVEAYFSKREPLVGPALAIAQAHVVRLGEELKGRSVPESEFPSFGVEVYERVLPSAQPRSGPAVAYYVLADAYDLLGERTAAQGAIGRAVDFLGQNPADRNIVPLLVKRCFDGLSGIEGDRPLIRKCVDGILEHRASGDSAPPTVLAYCVFAAADRAFEEGHGPGYLTTLTNVLREALVERPSGNDFWVAEILLREAKIAKARGDDPRAIASRYREALERGRAASSGSVILQAGHALGFDLALEARSLRELAASQFAVLEGVVLQETDYDRLERLGANLLSFWSSIDYRRLSEEDLGAIKLLRDPAEQMMHAGTQRDLAGAAMVFLLARLFGHSGPGRTWARERLEGQRAFLPEDTSQLIEL